MANDSYAIVMGDRRLVCNGCVTEDERNKVCTLFCNDARVAIAYTGIAQHFGFSTRVWLRESLSEIGKQHQDIDAILEHLRARASSVFRRFPNSIRHTAFLISGWRYGAGKTNSICQLLSNYDHRVNFPQSQPEFELRNLLERPGVVVEAAGCRYAITEDEKSHLRVMLKSSNPASAVLHKAVEIVQQISRARSRNIGTQCNSTVIPRAANTTIVSTYHTARPVNIVYASDIVSVVRGAAFVCDYMKMGSSGAILAGPLIRKNQDCWCGSGKKFKVCHLKKYGSTYARIAGFRRPMFMTMLVKGKRDVPIGTTYCVQSGFS